MVTGKPETKITLGFLKWGYPQSSISIGVSLLLPIIALCCLVPSCKSSHPNALSMWRCMRSQKRLMRSEVTDLEFCVFKFAHWKELEGSPVIKMIQQSWSWHKDLHPVPVVFPLMDPERMGRLLVYPRSELESTELTERTYKAVHLLKLLLFRAFMDADVRFAFEEIKNNTATPSFDMLMAAELDELFVVTGSAAAARRPISMFIMFMQRPDILNYLGRTFFTGFFQSPAASIKAFCYKAMLHVLKEIPHHSPQSIQKCQFPGTFILCLNMSNLDRNVYVRFQDSKTRTEVARDRAGKRCNS